jgi:hypothetical protein
VCKWLSNCLIACPAPPVLGVHVVKAELHIHEAAALGGVPDSSRRSSSSDADAAAAHLTACTKGMQEAFHPAAHPELLLT